MEQVYPIAVQLFIGAVVLLVAVLTLLGIRKAKRPNSPVLAELYDAIQPWIYKAVLAGEWALITSMDQADSKLQGMDKKSVADSIYDLLPEVVVVGTVPVPIGRFKLLVPREIFETWVKDAYDQAHAFILKNEAYLKSQVDGLGQAGTG